jgi:hypothetical protein
MSDLAGYVLFIAIALVGLGTVAIGSVRAWIWLDGRGLPVGASVTLMLVFAAVTLLGFWLIVDLYWMVRAGLRLVRWASVRWTDRST